ncbi:hypothetical protein BGZ83_007847 [Gryganskiella cystojenkinii]|nr:hypothetical protein BGZ83_007847 [Gryganskiella cystojenkinii]
MNGIIRVDSHQGLVMTMKKKQQQLQQQQSTIEHSSPSGNTNSSMSNINGKAYHHQQQHHHGRGPRPTLNNVSSMGLNSHPAPVSVVTAPSMVSNAMTSTIGWAKDETDKLLELEYKEEIFQYMKQMEKETMAVPEHMDLQPELTWDLRPLLVDFLIEIHTHFGLQPETLYLAMNMMDRYLSKRVVYKKHYQLVGMTSLWISSKYEDSKEKLPSVSQLCKLCSNTYDEAAFITMERHILKTLDYGLGHPTAEAFLKKDLELSGGQEDLRLRHVAQFLMELTMFTRCFLSFGSSTIAASALFLARSICGQPLVIPEDPNAFDCIRYLDNSLTNVSKTVHDKYARQRLSQASIIVKDWVDAGGRALIQPISTTTDGTNPLWTLSNMLWQPPSPIPTTFPSQGGAPIGHPPSTTATTTTQANSNATTSAAMTANTNAATAANGGAAATTTTTTTTTTTVTATGVAVATTSSMTTTGGSTDASRDGYYNNNGSSSVNNYQQHHHNSHHQPQPQQQQQTQRTQPIIIIPHTNPNQDQHNITTTNNNTNNIPNLTNTIILTRHSSNNIMVIIILMVITTITTTKGQGRVYRLTM